MNTKLKGGAKEKFSEGKFITINVYVKRKRMLSDKQPNKEPEKQEHTKPKINIRKAKNKMQINEIETKKIT